MGGAAPGQKALEHLEGVGHFALLADRTQVSDQIAEGRGQIPSAEYGDDFLYASIVLSAGRGSYPYRGPRLAVFGKDRKAHSYHLGPPVGNDLNYDGVLSFQVKG